MLYYDDGKVVEVGEVGLSGVGEQGTDRWCDVGAAHINKTIPTYLY